MVKVCVLQTDNRLSLDYVLKSREVNKKISNILNYDYLFIELDNNKYGNCHPATKKIPLINDFLQNTNYDILVFLDSDAWIENADWLKNIIDNLVNNDKKQGCFSRDPYFVKNTFINSGSFILKINDFTKQMYKEITQQFYKNIYDNNYPCDQVYISKYIFENKDNFVIYIPEILNTPLGKVLRHNWWKNERMYNDLNKLLSTDILVFDKTIFIEHDYHDKEEYPNRSDKGNEYNEYNNYS